MTLIAFVLTIDFIKVFISKEFTMHYLKVAANQVCAAKNLSNIWELALKKFIRHIVLDKK